MTNKLRFILLICGIIVFQIVNRGDVVYAAGTYHVSTAYTTITEVSENQYVVPLYLTNNQGIMGFRIMLWYNPEDITIETISQGELTKSGNFGSDSLVERDEDFVNIIWSGTENITSDGSLCYILVKVKDGCSNINLDLEYDQQDTFDEKWRDVLLDCEDVSFSLTKKDAQTDSDEVKSVIKLPEEEARFIEVTSELTQEDVVEEIGYDVVQKNVIEMLEQFRYDALSDIPAEKEEQFIEDLKQQLQEKEHVKKKLVKKLTYSMVENRITFTPEDKDRVLYGEEEIDDTQKNERKAVFIIIPAICLCVVCACIVLKKRRSGNEQKD